VHGCSCVAFTLARCRRDLQRSGNKHSSAPSGARLPAGRLLSRRGHHRGLSGGELGNLGKTCRGKCWRSASAMQQGANCMDDNPGWSPVQYHPRVALHKPRRGWMRQGKWVREVKRVVIGIYFYIISVFYNPTFSVYSEDDTFSAFCCKNSSSVGRNY
jgi:hypothetical protein